MDFENELRDRLKRAGAAMPVAPVARDVIVGRGRARADRTGVIRNLVATVAIVAGIAGAPAIRGAFAPPVPPVRGGVFAPAGGGLSAALPAPVDAVARWVVAVSEQDVTTAWDLLGSDSRFAIGGRAGLARALPSWSEGVGRWARLDGVRQFVAEVPARRGGRVYVVALYRLEGGEAIAFIVRRVSGAYRVEASPDYGPRLFVRASVAEAGAGPLLERPPTRDAPAVDTGSLDAWAGDAAGAVWFFVPRDGKPLIARPGAMAGGRTELAYRWTPRPPLRPGRHLFVAVARGRGDRFVATAARFDVP